MASDALSRDEAVEILDHVYGLPLQDGTEQWDSEMADKLVAEGVDAAFKYCPDDAAMAREWLDLMRGYVREYDGDGNLIRRWHIDHVTGGERGTVHKVGCRHAKHSLPWRPGSYYARKRACLACLPEGLPRA